MISAAGLWCSLLAGAVTVPANDARVQPIGAAELDERLGVRLRFSSAGVRLRAAGVVRFVFDGPDAIAHASPAEADDARGNVFVVAIDDGDGARRLVELPADGAVALGDDDAARTVTLIKRTEALFGERRLVAVSADALHDPPPPRGTLVVLGDSWATGFGVRGDIPDETGVAPGPNCPFSPQTQDVREAWPWLVAEQHDLDVAVVAWSGRGVLRDYEGSEETTQVPALFRGSTVAPARVVRVVVALGHNDGWIGAPAGEAAARFTAAFTALAAELRARFPGVPVVVVVPGFDDHPPAIDRDAAFRALLGPAGLPLVDEPTLDPALPFGCVWHPGTQAQAALARALGPQVMGVP